MAKSAIDTANDVLNTKIEVPAVYDILGVDFSNSDRLFWMLSRVTHLRAYPLVGADAVSENEIYHFQIGNMGDVLNATIEPRSLYEAIGEKFTKQDKQLWEENDVSKFQFTPVFDNPNVL